MADLHTYKKLPSDPCLTQEQITAYIDGKLSSAEQHACEQHMLECGMCEDAVEGLSLVKDRSVLTAPLAPLVPAETPTEGKVIPLHQPKRRMWYAAAAILVLVLGTTFVLRMTSYDNGNEMAEQKNAIADSTSISAPNGGYVLENAKAPMSDCLANTNSLKTAEDMSMEGQTYAERSVAGNAPKVSSMDKELYAVPEETEEAPVMRQDLETDEVVADDANASFDQGPAGTRNEDARAEKAQTTQQEAQAKKKTLLDLAKDGLASGAKTEQKKDAYFDNDRSTETKPNTNAPTQPNAPQTAVASGSVSYSNTGGVDSGSYVLSEVTTVTVNDSIAADQLELSYRNGVTQLNAGQANSAIVLFDKVLADKNHPRYDDAEFQKAKALIKANRKEEAKTLLKAIEVKKGKHAAEATELLKTL